MQLFASLTTAVLAFAGALAVSAAPSYSDAGSECDTGPTHCCDSVQPANSKHVSGILGALGIPIPVGNNDQVGLTCTPINAVAAGGSQSCTQVPVCCNGNSFGGLSLGCSPIPAIV
ncbi:hypothetical protein BD413DRAFT_610475 [Trametes elegans]|nr:hypothetical protein BD413DRAFT_610475 [Trametes elegans]